MEKQITRIDKTAMAKASRLSNVNKSVTFQDVPPQRRDMQNHTSKDSSKKSSPRASKDVTPRRGNPKRKPTSQRTEFYDDFTSRLEDRKQREEQIRGLSDKLTSLNEMQIENGGHSPRIRSRTNSNSQTVQALQKQTQRQVEKGVAKFYHQKGSKKART